MARTIGHPVCRRARREGFSLTEVLLALSILGIGLAMVMAVFPAAIEESRNSVENVLGTIICENGLSICKVRVPRASVAGTTLAPVALSSSARTYPADSNDATRGFLVLGRRLNVVRNEYQLVIVSYAKRQVSNDVKAEFIGKSIDPNATQLTVNAGQKYLLQLGSPVIDAATGNYATILAVNDQTAVLDHGLGSAGGTLYFIIETSGGSPLSGAKVSPAMTVMVARTGLNQ